MVFSIPQRHENLDLKSERIAFTRLAEFCALHNGVTCYGFFKGHFAVSSSIYLLLVVWHWTGISSEWECTRPVGWSWLWSSAEWKDSYQFQVPMRVSEMRPLTKLAHVFWYLESEEICIISLMMYAFTKYCRVYQVKYDGMCRLEMNCVYNLSNKTLENYYFP
jgi:hypothetical protein